MKGLIFFFFAAIAICCRCRPDNADAIYYNGTIGSVRQLDRIIAAPVPNGVRLTPPRGIYPVSGTVSHHLLVAPVINKWFLYLKGLRNIETFIIISPNHARRGLHFISLSNNAWLSAGIVTKVNTGLTSLLMEKLETTEDVQAFENEHGIEALLPFINRYFPGADIVPILVDEQQKHMRGAAVLADSISGMVEKNKNIFVIISVDFSHRRNRAVTDILDAYSKESLLSLNAGSRIYSDNNTGLFILFRICKKLGTGNTWILGHTDSEKFVSGDLELLTSYFFTYQY